ncbi:MAG: WecB/TagA/CpsF family glycosyltransferase [Caldilineaceae bacterium]
MGDPTPEEWPVIVDALTAAAPDILLWRSAIPSKISGSTATAPSCRRVAMGVGGAFDFVAGVTRRAPRWLQRLGLEWLHRLLREPWRWRRMLKLPVFVALVVQDRARHWSR